MTKFPNKVSDFVPAPEGVHLAVCKYEGLCFQKSLKYPETEDGRATKQRYIFQIDERVPGKTQRFEVRISFGRSMGKKSAQRKFIQEWLLKTFTEKEAEDFDSAFMVGRAAQVTIEHNDSSGTVYANIKGVMPLPKGIMNPPFNVEWYEWEGKSQKTQWDKDHKEVIDWLATQQNTAQPEDSGDGSPF